MMLTHISVLSSIVRRQVRSTSTNIFFLLKEKRFTSRTPSPNLQSASLAYTHVYTSRSLILNIRFSAYRRANAWYYRYYPRSATYQIRIPEKLSIFSYMMLATYNTCRNILGNVHTHIHTIVSQEVWWLRRGCRIVDVRELRKVQQS